jgi:hypothetical protein
MLRKAIHFDYDVHIHRKKIFWKLHVGIHGDTRTILNNHSYCHLNKSSPPKKEKRNPSVWETVTLADTHEDEAF